MKGWPKAAFGPNGKLKDQLLNGGIFYTLREAIILIDRWRQQYNTLRPHSSLGYQPPDPETILPNLLHDASTPSS